MNDRDDVVGPYLIRKRPELYVGGTNTLGVLRIIRDLLECGHGTSSATIEVRQAAVLIELTCTPPSVAPRTGSTTPFVIEACTTVSINVDTPPTLGQTESLDDRAEPPVFRRDGGLTMALAIANALSTDFVISSRCNGIATTFRFERGVQTGGPETSSTGARDGLAVLFAPDSVVLGPHVLRFENVVHVARDVACVRRHAVKVIDHATGRRIDLA